MPPTVLRAYLCDPPGLRSTFSWARLIAVTGRSLSDLQNTLEQERPPSPPQLLCEYCGAPPPAATKPSAPWWCTDRCRRRSNLLASAPSSRDVLPGQRAIVSCLGCGTRFIRSTRSTRNTCSKRCLSRSIRDRDAELALYENPNAVETDAFEDESP